VVHEEDLVDATRLEKRHLLEHLTECGDQRLVV
jgi:hypothetical protein